MADNQSTAEKEEFDHPKIQEHVTEHKVEVKLLTRSRPSRTKFIHSRDYSDLQLESRIVHSNYYIIEDFPKDIFASETLL